MNNRVQQIRRYKKMFAKHYDFLMWLNIEKLCDQTIREASNEKK